MTSILKVSTIQNTAGTAPTAADLGLNVSNSVINVHHVTSTTQTKGSAGAWISTAFPKTITPSSSGSKFVVSFSAGG